MTATRRALHSVAEYLLAGPQYRASGTIRLRVSDGGFATVAEPSLRVDGRELVADGARYELAGATLTDLARAADLDGGAPDSYESSADTRAEDELEVDLIDAARLADALATGDAALRGFAPDEEPVLWPEHFDIAIRLDDVNYGVSPGDDYLNEPYAYVGVDPVPDDEFWNAPFGAARPLAELVGVEAVTDFFSAGRSQR
jgi:hypothetical protein